MDPTQLQPGYRLDRYELLCPLAYGGMASVWLARFGGRLGFERLVVIKMILPQYSQDPRFQEMFLDEARIASKIEHSNVARILDVGEHEDNYFIVMEWVDGDSLSKVLRAAEQRKQRVPPGIALRIIADAAAGLHAAHELTDRDGTHLGVVHRDVSPQNILIANNGTTVIIDFGVAKARDRVSQETSAGQLKGKIRYMAPEQALGKNLDHRADVWALGAMLYEMFTGLPPYDGPNEVATLHKLTSGERPPPLPRTMPEVLRAVVERALAYDPDQRFATALELNLALEGAMVEINEPTTPAIVAHYTGQLLTDRKTARRRAVDTALDAARKRDTGERVSLATPLAPPSTASLPVPPFGMSSTRSLLTPASGDPRVVSNPYDVAQTETHSEPSLTSSSVPSRPSSVGPHGAMSLSESPSATSSATLGSAAIEYPPIDILQSDRRRKHLTAATLGILVAAGFVGLILIISSTVFNKSAKTTAASSAAPPPVESVVGALPTVSAAPATTPTTPAETVDLDEPTTPTATTAATPPTTTTTVAATPPTSATTPSTHTPTSTHRPITAPAPTKRPPPPPTSTRPDRGF